jgi:glycosyltransferase involved in cell wall biosynthesis
MIAPSEQTAAYNEFVLPQRGRYELSIASFLPSEVRVPPDVGLYEGDGTVTGFRRSLERALVAEPAIVHAHSVHVAVLYLLARSSSRRAASVFTLHSSFRNENLKMYHRALLVPVLAAFDRSVCVGRSSLASLPWVYRRIAGNRLLAIPNGVDLERADRAWSPELERSRTTITSVSRLIPIKDPLTIVRAVARLARRDVELIFVGEGPLREAIEDFVREEDLADRVSLLGPIPREEVYRRLWSTGVFVSASRGEGLPVAALEALACECPSVLTDIPPHREIAAGADGVTLIPPGEPSRLALALERILDLPPDESAELGRAGRVHVQERFGIAAMQAAYSGVYSHLLGVAGPLAQVEE